MERTKISEKRDITDTLWDKGVFILSCSLYFLCGFILSGAGLLSVSVPLSIGLVAACSGWEMVFAAAGAVLGSIFRLSDGELLNSLIPLCGIAGIKFALEKIRVKNRKTWLSVSVFLLYFACSIAVMFSYEPSLNSLLLNLCSALLCAGSVVFYSGTNECIRKRQSPYMLDNHSLICIIISLCTLLLGTGEISLMGFRPARFFGSFIIITAAYLFSQSGGSISGTAIGVSVAVSGTSIALSLCYGICGLVAGIFSKFGRLICSLAFSLTAGIAALIDGTPEGISVFAEAAAASILFNAVPGKQLAKIRANILNPQRKRIETEFHRASERLMETSKAVGSVSSCVAKVSEGIEALAPAKDIMVCMRVRERVCSQCPLKSTFCPENGEFSNITAKLASGETVTAEDFSVNFNSKCPSVPRLADSFNKIYAGQNAINALQANSARNRELACGQFEWISTLLSELSQELENGACVLFNHEKAAARVLGEFDFEVKKVSCVRPSSGAIRLTCTVEDIPAGTSLTRLTAAVSAELGAEFMPPRIRQNKDSKDLLFIRKELFKIRLGSASASCSNQKLCGDYFECFQTESKAYIILSDGMGTGGRAAIDSAMTVELFSRLIRAGVSLDTALSITNTALAVKSDDESLSTLDIAEIDLFDGNAVLLKAGAAPSFYTCSGRVKTAEVPSTPLGILNNVKFSRYALKLRGGDMLVIASDGIMGCGNRWITDEIKGFSGTSSASDFAELLLNTARLKCGEKYDDMTVVCAVIEEV